MRRTLLGCMTLALLAAPVGGADMAQIKARGKLRVLVSADETPEVFSLTPGARPGLEREMLDAFVERHGLALVVVPVRRWDGIIHDLLEDTGDLIAGIIDTQSRRQRVAFTLEVLPSRHMVVTRKPQPVVRRLEDLRFLRVAEIPGTSWAEAAGAAGVPTARMEPCLDTAGVVEALRTGRAGAAVVSVTIFPMALRLDRDLEAGIFLGAPASVSWAVRKGDIHLKRALDAHIEATRKTSWRALVVKYFGEDGFGLLERAARN